MEIKFVNLKVDIKLISAICLDKNSGAFDSVLAILDFNGQKNRGVFNGDFTQKLEYLDMTDGVYHTSFPIINDIKYYQKEQLVKSFDHDFYAKFGVLQKKNGAGVGKIDTVQNRFKNGFYTHERVLAKSVTYYVRGNKEKIEDLLSKLRYLGKKASLGWGEIEYIEVKEINQDYSIVKNETLMRNIPKANSFNINSGKVALYRLTHPYWKRAGLAECYMP